MDSALRKDDFGLAKFAEDKPAGVPRDGRLRQFRELGESDSVVCSCFRDERVQPRTENNRYFGIPAPQSGKRRLAHDQAAEIGGADSGFLVPAITSGCKLSSRIGVIFASCLGYAMRVWSMVIKVKRKRSAMRLRSARVRSHSTSWPSAILWLIRSFTSCSIFCGVGFSRLREALSTMSARLMIALSLDCGFGPL